MDGHAFRVINFPHNLNAVDGQHFATFHKRIRGGVFG